MKKYAVSGTSNANFLLEEVEDIFGTEQEAHAEAEALTKDSGDPHYVYEVDIKIVKGYRQVRTVEGFHVGRQ